MSFFTPPPPTPVGTDPATFRIRAINAWAWLYGTLLNEFDALHTLFTAALAAMNTNDTRDTSTSSVLIGTGTKVFTVSAGKSFSAGQWLTISNTPAPTNQMIGNVTSYSGTTLTVTVPTNGVFGSGTLAAWTIALTAAPSTQVSAAMAPVVAAASLVAARAALVVGTRLLQNLTFQTGVLASGTTVIPLDNTIPQITEGDQYLTLSITPTSASSTLEIDVTAVGSVSAAQTVILALFQDAIASALASAYQYTPSGGAPFIFPLKHVMLAGSTSPITFRVRIGPTTASTFYLNGDGGASRLGGTLASRITIREYAA